MQECRTCLRIAAWCEMHVMRLDDEHVSREKREIRNVRERSSPMQKWKGESDPNRERLISCKSQDQQNELDYSASSFRTASLHPIPFTSSNLVYFPFHSKNLNELFSPSILIPAVVFLFVAIGTDFLLIRFHKWNCCLTLFLHHLSFDCSFPMENHFIYNNIVLVNVIHFI